MHEDDYHYLEDGTCVEVVEKTPTGFIVQHVFENGEDAWTSEEKVFAEKVFDVAPTRKCHSRIKQLDADIKAREARLSEINEKIEKSLIIERQAIERIAKFDALKYVMSFIDGKLTHYVVKEYCGVKIIPLEEAITQDQADEKWNKNRALKLLTLFGGPKRNINWALNKYSDGSGSNAEAYPCTSYEEAVKTASGLVIAQFSDKSLTPNEYTIKSADEFNVPVPTEYRKAFVDQKRKSILSGISERELNLAALQKQLDELNTQDEEPLP